MITYLSELGSVFRGTAACLAGNFKGNTCSIQKKQVIDGLFWGSLS